jgi:hypothetical protein
MITKATAIAKGYEFRGDESRSLVEGIALTRAKQSSGFRARVIKEVIEDAVFYRVYVKPMKKTAREEASTALAEQPSVVDEPKVKAKPKTKKALVEEPARWTMKTIPEDMKNRITRMMQITWECIGDDVLADGQDMGRSDVIDMVVDADRMGMYGGDVAAYETYLALDGALKAKLGVLAFPNTIFSA